MINKILFGIIIIYTFCIVILDIRIEQLCDDRDLKQDNIKKMDDSIKVLNKATNSAEELLINQHTTIKYQDSIIKEQKQKLKEMNQELIDKFD